MHDLDRTLDASEAELEGTVAGDFESELGADFGEEYEDQLEIFADSETGGVFDQAEEMELAAELLAVSDEYELEQFLGDLIKTVGSKVHQFAKSSTGRYLGGLLKSAVKKALPMVGGTAGSALGAAVGGAAGSVLGPDGSGVGSAIGRGVGHVAGRKLGSAAGDYFGLELEGLSPEDQEFEVARRFVRFSASAAKKAARAPRSAPAAQVARAAVKTAARKHAPGLLRRGPSARAVGGRRRSGRWIRRGRRIIVLGA